MNLKLSEDGGGPRHYLEGQPVTCGTQLRMRVRLDNGGETWVWARYEACLAPGRAAVFLHTWHGIVCPNEDTFLRWPTEEEKR